MNKIFSPARRPGTLSLLQRGYAPKPRTTRPLTNPAKSSGRSQMLAKGVSSTSPDATGPSSTAPIVSSASRFTSKLYSPPPPVVPPHERCGPAGPPGKNGFEPGTTALPFIILTADDNTLHRFFIRKVPNSDPAEYTTYVEQAPYTI